MCSFCVFPELQREHGQATLKKFEDFKDPRTEFRAKPWESFNFIVLKEHEYATPEWAMKELFQTFLEETLYTIEGQDFHDILVKAGVFSSKSQAMKAGVSRELPAGFMDKTFGKRKTRICIFNAI